MILNARDAATPEAIAAARAAERDAEDARWLGERPDPSTMTVDDLAQEIRAGDMSLGATSAEARARTMTGRVSVEEMVTAARADAAWSRRRARLRGELDVRERYVFDAETLPDLRRRALALRAAYLAVARPEQRAGALWGDLPTGEARAWVAVAEHADLWAGAGEQRP